MCKRACAAFALVCIVFVVVVVARVREGQKAKQRVFVQSFSQAGVVCCLCRPPELLLGAQPQFAAWLFLPLCESYQQHAQPRLPLCLSPLSSPSLFPFRGLCLSLFCLSHSFVFLSLFLNQNHCSLSRCCCRRCCLCVFSFCVCVVVVFPFSFVSSLCLYLIHGRSQTRCLCLCHSRSLIVVCVCVCVPLCPALVLSRVAGPFCLVLLLLLFALCLPLCLPLSHFHCQSETVLCRFLCVPLSLSASLCLCLCLRCVRAHVRVCSL